MIMRIWWGGAIVWLAVAWIWPLPIRTDVGRWDTVAVEGFYDAEYGAGTSFRWSRPDATITVAGVGAGQYDVQLMASAVSDTALIVRVADSEHLLTITPGFNRYTVPVTVTVGRYDHVVVHVHVPVPQSVDRRVVGVALDEIRLVPRGLVWPAWSAWMLSAVVIGLTAFWSRWWVRRPTWRLLAAVMLVSGVVLLRRGDAVQILWMWMLVSALGIVIGQQWSLPKRHIGWLVVAGTGLSLTVVWFGGIAVWQPLWQLLIFTGAVWGMRWRRWWWSGVSPYRTMVLLLVFICFAVSGPIGWVLAGVGGLVWFGAQRWEVVRAAASVGSLITQWLQGRNPPHADMISRRFGLDVVRAFAISVVVIGHASATLGYYPTSVSWIPQWFAFVGVECFFVLSGWLIGGLIVRSLPTWQRQSAVQYFLHRRWGRTLPPYWLMLAMVALAGWGGASWSAMVPYWMFGQNLWQAHPPYFFVAWSLSVEEWFYLIVAIGLAVMVRIVRPARALLGVLLVLIIIPFVMRTYVALGEMPWETSVRQFVPLRLDAIAIGMLAVWYWHASGRQSTHWQTWLGMLGAVTSVVFFSQQYAELNDSIWPRLLLIPLTTISVVLLLPACASWHVTEYRGWHRSVQWLACVSYSLYLIHIPWRLTIEGLFGGVGRTWWYDLMITMLYFIGAIWFAGQWYRLLEAPLMALRWSEETATPRLSGEG